MNFILFALGLAALVAGASLPVRGAARSSLLADAWCLVAGPARFGVAHR
jgi:hypothetical protein